MSSYILHLSHPVFNPTGGGTEIFIDRFINELRGAGIESMWTFHAPTPHITYSRHYIHALPPLVPDQVHHYNHLIDDAHFEDLLVSAPPALLHVHGISALAGLAHVRIAKRHNIPVVLTLHSPSDICQQGMLLEAGVHRCDGLASKLRCTACHLSRSGIPSVAADILALSLPFNRHLRTPSSKLSRALSIKTLHQSYISVVEEIISASSAVHLLSHWYYNLMCKRFGNYSSKFKFIRSASPLCIPDLEVLRGQASCERPLVSGISLGYIGRIAHTKGIEMLLHALSRATFFRPVQCTFYGFDPDDDYSLSVNRLSRELGLEQIVRFEPFVERNRLPSVLSNIDMLLIPSEWDEVGPLVMYEALSLGVPVAATALGAPAEVLPSVKNSYLLPYDANSWQAFLTDLSRGRISLHRSVYYSRSFSELASEVASSVYSSLIN